jgi:hypothetical protein
VGEKKQRKESVQTVEWKSAEIGVGINNSGGAGTQKHRGEKTKRMERMENSLVNLQKKRTHGREIRKMQ